jgi:hypothetical protein
MHEGAKEELLDSETGELLAHYDSSLITVIFKVETLIDPTIFFITGAHETYVFTPDEVEPDVIGVVFSNPRIPLAFQSLLPGDPNPKAPPKKKQGKKCAFVNIKLIRTHDELSADIKLFHQSIHVCGTRNPNIAQCMMRFIQDAFLKCQMELDKLQESPELIEDLEPERRGYILSNLSLCSVPLVLSEGDVVMTNLRGSFPTTINLRSTYQRLQDNYPGIYTYLTTMSKSNYLGITFFEGPPFEPIRSLKEIQGSRGWKRSLKKLKDEIEVYLLSNKKKRSKYSKHTFFVYASGCFIQSSRNHATSLKYTELCMKLLGE